MNILSTRNSFDFDTVIQDLVSAGIKLPDF